MKRFSLIFIALAVAMSALGQGFSYVYKGVEFKGKIKDGTACIKSFDKKAPEVIIPAAIAYNGVSYPVKSVSVFMNGVNYSTVRMTLEEGIEDIDKFCFNEFRKLSLVNLPLSLRHIGKVAFRDNKGMVLNMPSSIDEVSLRKGYEMYPDGSGSIMAFGVPKQKPVQEKTVASDNVLAQAVTEELPYVEEKHASKSERVQKARREKNNGGFMGALAGVFAGKRTETLADNSTEQPVKAAEIPELPVVDVDIDIPVVKTSKNANTYCVIIANEKYEDVPVVDYAERDGTIFKEYCIKTLGIPERQVKTFINASYTDVKRALNWIETMTDISEGNSKVIFYYAGHGIPNEKDKAAYLIPTDGFPKDITTCFKLSDLYGRLGRMKSQNVTVLLDACFSGVKRGSGQALIAARGVAIKPKEEVLPGNMVVFTAASDDETALSYLEKRHGMFTYFLLDKLKKTEGNISFGELFKSLSTDVKKNSMLENDKLQTPSVNFSRNLNLTWENMKF